MRESRRALVSLYEGKAPMKQTNSLLFARAASLIKFLLTRRLGECRLVVCMAVLSVGFGAQSMWAQSPGSFDLALAGTGKIMNVGTLGGGAVSVALQSDGKIVVLGCAGRCLARFNADGTPDLAFNGPNAASPGAGVFTLPTVAGAEVTYQALALQADGKIVLAGKRYNSNDWDFSLARFNADGTYDTSFDGPSGTANGAFALPVDFSAATSDEEAYALAIQPDGKILVSGFCGAPEFAQACVARLNSNGTFDTSFEADGKLQIAISGVNNVFNAIAVQSDGKIVFSGTCDRLNASSSFCLARVNPDGSADNSFAGAPGVLRFNISTGRDSGNAMTLQADGKIVVAGTCLASGMESSACVARLNSDGTFDGTFSGPMGVASGRILLNTPRLACMFAASTAITAEGKIVIAGFRGQLLYSACLVRINSDGSYDKDFDGDSGGGDGLVNLFDLAPTTSGLTSVALQPDGKLVAAGFCGAGIYGNTCVARFTGGPFLNRCSFDIDGNGTVTATTDLLIATRVALGMRGDSVVYGIQFPINATRNDWPKVRDYFFNQCGINTY
jgi:uncharacterized delta-60 repeat protein